MLVTIMYVLNTIVAITCKRLKTNNESREYICVVLKTVRNVRKYFLSGYIEEDKSKLSVL